MLRGHVVFAKDTLLCKDRVSGRDPLYSRHRLRDNHSEKSNKVANLYRHQVLGARRRYAQRRYPPLRSSDWLLDVRLSLRVQSRSYMGEVVISV